MAHRSARKKSFQKDDCLGTVGTVCVTRNNKITLYDLNLVPWPHPTDTRGRYKYKYMLCRSAGIFTRTGGGGRAILTGSLASKNGGWPSDFRTVGAGAAPGRVDAHPPGGGWGGHVVGLSTAGWYEWVISHPGCVGWCAPTPSAAAAGRGTRAFVRRRARRSARAQAGKDRGRSRRDDGGGAPSVFSQDDARR